MPQQLELVEDGIENKFDDIELYYWETVSDNDESVDTNMANNEIIAINKNTNKYDFIVLGEVLEHLDEPKEILVKLSKLLKPGGLLWITTPTNAPALDHVYLFNTKEEVVTLINDSGLETVASCNYFAEDMDEKTALKNKITNLVGLFCKNRQA
jgi:2-polyprenyl-3-methyl-5-hydroxy-6-metoxy-1,4-benzoquinol methylase